MQYYRDSVTEQSWQLLKKLRRKFKFILIGGWAVWLYTRQLKSKDIDVVIELGELDRLKSDYELIKNERLKKYEFRRREVEVDVYVPFYSMLGVPAEEILKGAKLVEGFWVPEEELLLILKSVTWLARRGSAKGRKDFVDIVSLLAKRSYEVAKLEKWLKAGKGWQAITELRQELELTRQVPELGLNVHQLAKARKQWLAVWPDLVK